MTSDADAGPLGLVATRLPAGTVALAWATPAANAQVSGMTTLTLAGQGLVNVEVFDNGSLGYAVHRRGERHSGELRARHQRIPQRSY